MKNLSKYGFLLSAVISVGSAVIFDAGTMVKVFFAINAVLNLLIFWMIMEDE